MGYFDQRGASPPFLPFSRDPAFRLTSRNSRSEFIRGSVGPKGAALTTLIGLSKRAILCIEATSLLRIYAYVVLCKLPKTTLRFPAFSKKHILDCAPPPDTS